MNCSIPVYIDLLTSSVYWSSLSKDDFDLPFFNFSVEKLITERRNTVRTNLQSLLRSENIDNQKRISGLIFHVSRCGSTLVSNIIKQLGNHVISEAQPISALLTPYCQSKWKITYGEWLANHKQLLKGLFSSFCKSALDKPIFIKFSSWNIFLIDTILEVCPSVPMLFIIRHPVEVLISLKRKTAGWVRLKGDSAMISSLTGLDPNFIERLTSDEFILTVLNLYYLEMIKHLSIGNVRCINYPKLNNQGLSKILEFFNISCEGKIYFIEEEMSKNSKELNKKFTNDSSNKWKEASDLLLHLDIEKSFKPYDTISKFSIN